jgi:NAD-dependent dihydropyrimidine dehydrogenase PreA subunit
MGATRAAPRWRVRTLPQALAERFPVGDRRTWQWIAQQHDTKETSFMTYVITQPCVGVKDASCVDVCPVDCIHPTESEAEFATVEMLYINPEECIDCGACEPACPVTAIFEESAVPVQWQEYIKINADYFKAK